MGTIVFVFGDSLVWGSWDSEGGWAGRLRRFLMEREIDDESRYFVLYNLGVSGETTAGLRARFESEVKARLREERQYLILFATGINDSVYLQDREPRTAPADFKRNLESLLDCGKEITGKIVLVGLTPVDEAKTAPSSWNPELFYRNAHIQAYDAIVKETARERSLPFIDLAGVFSEADVRAHFEDGLHPDAWGHQKLFERVRDFLS
ncbi:hypothetical protein HYW68_01610 [Candidatus Parcubacteria bacterium]|nr:hypothetical protein [Candidatus Parcubacteria bacterium]